MSSVNNCREDLCWNDNVLMTSLDSHWKIDFKTFDVIHWKTDRSLLFTKKVVKDISQLQSSDVWLLSGIDDIYFYLLFVVALWLQGSLQCLMFSQGQCWFAVWWPGQGDVRRWCGYLSFELWCISASFAQRYEIRFLSLFYYPFALKWTVEIWKTCIFVWKVSDILNLENKSVMEKTVFSFPVLDIILYKEWASFTNHS